MKEKKKDFIYLLGDLCDIYKDYIDNNINSKLEVYINNNTIKIYLNNNNEVIDEFGLTFNQKEKDIYNYISIVLIKLLFGNKIVFSKDNMFFGDINKMSLKIIVDDYELFNKMFGIISLYNDMDFYDKMDNSRRIKNKINRSKNVSNLDDRINITRKLLRARGME